VNTCPQPKPRPRWTAEQTATLRELYGSTLTLDQIGQRVGRSKEAAKCKAHQMGLVSVLGAGSAPIGDFTMDQLADKLGVHRTTVESWHRRGCPARKVGGRNHLVFRWAKVMRWLTGYPRIFAHLPASARGSMNVDFDMIPVSPSEAAARIGISPTALRCWIADGCPHVWITPTMRGYIVADVMRWMLENPKYGQNMSSRYVGEWRERLAAKEAA